jgi:hypothetical protein
MDLSSLWNLIWIWFILSSLTPLFQKQWLAATRRRMLASISDKRDATVITLIHRQETISLLGFPIMRHIDIDDSQSVLRAIRSHSEPARAREVAHLLSSGVWTHDHPLMAHELGLLGLPVRFGVAEEERTLLDLYPQPRGREQGVEYFPGRPIPGLPQGRETPRPRDSR